MNRPHARPTIVALVAVSILTTPSCSTVEFPSQKDLKEFELAGPIVPEYDSGAMPPFQHSSSPYRIRKGDVLTIDCPTSLFELSPSPTATAVKQYSVRVDDKDSVSIPLIGRVKASSLTVTQLHERIADAITPNYYKTRPYIHVAIKTRRTKPITVHGAVRNPGVYDIRTDRLSLLSAIGAAGGVAYSVDQPGARLIRIRNRPFGSPTAIALPVKHLSIPVQDVALEGGETIEVIPFSRQIFTAIGLVNQPGAHSYPTDTEYSLLQALAIAGGTDRLADPPYATIFRRTRDGRTISATFPISEQVEGTPTAAEVRIKPGDIISVQHTPGSWTRALAAEILRLQVGFFVDPRSL